MTINKRTNGRNCPYCAGYRVNHTNCLWNTRPDIAKLFTDSNLGYSVTIGCHDKADFTCPDCGNIDEKIISNITKRGYTCSRCSDGISYPEKLIMSLLEQLNVDYQKQKTFKWSNRKIYDFFIPTLNVIIETHGEQHYERGFGYRGGRSVEEEQENDKLKEKLARENGIYQYIVLDCRKSDLEYIKTSVINSGLFGILNLNKVNWMIAHEFACNSSMIKIACDLWNEGIKSTSEIGKTLKISKRAAWVYLKQGSILGWCDYQVKSIKKREEKTECF
jgi:hypothetical protein